MKKGTRICAAGLLAMTMALGSAPVLGVMTSTVALADEAVTVNGQTVTLNVEKDNFAVVTSTGSSYNVAYYGADQFSSVVDSITTANSIVVLGEGTFEMNSSSAAINAPLTIQGAGADKTVLKGNLATGNSFVAATDADTISISGVKLVATAGDQNGVTVSKPNAKLNISDTEFQGYKYAVYMNDSLDKDSVVTMTNVKLTNVWAAIYTYDNYGKIGDVSFADGSTFLYAVQAKGGARNAVYSTVDAYKADTEMKTNNMGGVFETGPAYTSETGYVCVATVDDYKYTNFGNAFDAVKDGSTLTLMADAKVGAETIDENDVTIEGNGHTLTTTGLFTVKGDDFAMQDLTMVGTVSGNALLKLAAPTNDAAAIDVAFKDVTLDNRAGNEAIDAEHVDLAISGEFNVVSGVNAKAGVKVANNAYGKSTVSFASDATLSYNDVSGKGCPMLQLVPATAGAALPTVTTDNSAIGLNGEDVLDSNDKVASRNVYAHMHNYVLEGAVDATADEDGYTGDQVCSVCGDTIKGETIPATGYANVTLTRLYNRFTGEHLFTGDQDEIDTLVGLGWTNEGAAWTAPGKSETPVYRLYNPFTGDHHYTANADEYDALEAEGWKKEGVAWYAADSEADGAVAVYRLYNPYAKTATHHFTTDANEVVELVKAGWTNEGVAWYGLK